MMGQESSQIASENDGRAGAIKLEDSDYEFKLEPDDDTIGAGPTPTVTPKSVKKRARAATGTAKSKKKTKSRSSAVEEENLEKVIEDDDNAIQSPCARSGSEVNLPDSPKLAYDSVTTTTKHAKKSKGRKKSKLSETKALQDQPSSSEGRAMKEDEEWGSPKDSPTEKARQRVKIGSPEERLSIEVIVQPPEGFNPLLYTNMPPMFEDEDANHGNSSKRPRLTALQKEALWLEENASKVKSLPTASDAEGFKGSPMPSESPPLNDSTKLKRKKLPKEVSRSKEQTKSSRPASVEVDPVEAENDEDTDSLWVVASSKKRRQKKPASLPKRDSQAMVIERRDSRDKDVRIAQLPTPSHTQLPRHPSDHSLASSSHLGREDQPIPSDSDSNHSASDQKKKPNGKKRKRQTGLAKTGADEDVVAMQRQKRTKLTNFWKPVNGHSQERLAIPSSSPVETRAEGQEWRRPLTQQIVYRGTELVHPPAENRKRQSRVARTASPDSREGVPGSYKQSQPASTPNNLSSQPTTILSKSAPKFNASPVLISSKSSSKARSNTTHIVTGSGQKPATIHRAPASSPTKTSTDGYSPVIRSGAFNDEEASILADELQKFRDQNDMNVFDQNQLITKGRAEGRSLWNQLHEALPNRTLDSIVKFCRRKFNNFPARGTWSEEQDAELKVVFAKCPGKWKLLGELLNRHPEDVRDRWRNYLVCGDQLKKSYWDGDEERSLKVIVNDLAAKIREADKGKQKETATPSVGDSDMPVQYANINWQLVSEKMGHTRNRLQCIAKWKSICAREAEVVADNADLDLNGKSWRIVAARKTYSDLPKADKLALLFAIQESRAVREGKIPWKLLGDDGLRSRLPVMVRKVTWKMMRGTIRGNLEIPLQEIVGILIHRLSPADEKEESTMQLETLKYSQKLKHTGRRNLKAAPLSEEVVVSDSEQDTLDVASTDKPKNRQMVQQTLPPVTNPIIISDDDIDASGTGERSANTALGLGQDLADGIEDENGEKIEAETMNETADEDLSLKNLQISGKHSQTKRRDVDADTSVNNSPQIYNDNPKDSPSSAEEDQRNENIGSPSPHSHGESLEKPDPYEDSEHGSFDKEAARKKAIEDGYHGILEVDPALREYWRDRKYRLNIFLEAMVRPGVEEIDLEEATAIFDKKYEIRWPMPVAKNDNSTGWNTAAGENSSRHEDVVNWVESHSQEREERDDTSLASSGPNKPVLGADGKPIRTMADLLLAPSSPRSAPSKTRPAFLYEPSSTGSESGDDDMSDIPARRPSIEEMSE